MNEGVVITSNIADGVVLSASLSNGGTITGSTATGAQGPIGLTGAASTVPGPQGIQGITGPAGTTDHTLLTNIGTNTHAQVDTALTRLANTSGTNTGDQTRDSLAVDTDDTVQFKQVTAGTTTDVIGKAVSVIRNNVEVGKIDNNSSGLRVQATAGTLQLRGTGNTGISVDASGNAAVAGQVTGSNLSGTNTGDNAVNSNYSGLVTNATHTGEVTGSGALTIDPTAITGKTAVTAVGTDYILISDTSDAGSLKKALASDLAVPPSIPDNIEGVDGTRIDVGLGATFGAGVVLTPTAAGVDNPTGFIDITTPAPYMGISVNSGVDGSGDWTPSMTLSDNGVTFDARGALAAENISFYGANMLMVNSATMAAAYIDFTAITANRTLTVPNATGTLALTSDIPAAGIANVVEDTTPQLGGNLDTNGHNLQVSGTSGTLAITSSVDGGEYNIGASASGTLAIFGSGANTLHVNLLDGNLTVAGTGNFSGTVTAPILKVNATAYIDGATAGKLDCFGQIDARNGMYIYDGYNINIGTGTGTKIGAATNEKIGFFGATPVVRPSGSLLTALTNLGLVATPTIAISDITGLQTALDNKLDDTQFSGLSKITVGTTAPGTPATGDVWIDTN